MNVPFAKVLAEATGTVAGLTATVPHTWQQGRTAYGGISAALALEAARSLGGDALPPLRSAAVSFVGPLAGEVEASARILRSGKNATWISAEIATEGKIGLTASFVFMGPVASALHLNERPLPDGLIALDDAAPFAFHDLSPVFLKNNFEVRFALSRGSAKKPELCWWLRLVDRSGLDPMTELMLIADALPPGVLPLLDARVPVSSMIWQANVLTPAPSTDDGWWLLQSAGDYAENGCSSQRMAIWNTRDEPVLAGMQSVAVFG